MAAECPWGQVSSAGNSWPGGTPCAVPARCPAVPATSPLVLPAGHRSLGAAQEVGALQTGAQTEPGAEKKDGKTREKTYPLLRLFLLMKSRALPEPEGMERGLSKTRLGKHSVRQNWSLCGKVLVGGSS